MFKNTELRTWHHRLKSRHPAVRRVEWVIELFCDFLKRALCCRSSIFLWVQFQKIGEFHFKKFTGTLKMIFCVKICKYLSFTSKNNCQKLNSKLKFVKFFLFSKNWQNVSLFIFSYKKIRNTVCFRSNL